MRADGTRTSGSAIQLSAGLLLGTCHTFRRADQIVILHANRPFKAQLEKADALHDLCLLRTAKFSGGEVERVASTQLRVGDPVSAYGFASGFRMSIARGRITALHRYDDAYVIRTSARFPLGASGGALFDASGRLVGVLAFRAPEPRLNYALPMEWVEDLLAAAIDPQEMPTAPAFWERETGETADFLRAAQLEHQGDWMALRDQAVRWLRHDAKDAEAWRSLGRAQLTLGESVGALSSLENAVSLQPGSPDAWYWLARAAGVLNRGEVVAHARAQLKALDEDLAADLDGITGNSGR